MRLGNATFGAIAILLFRGVLGSDAPPAVAPPAASPSPGPAPAAAVPRPASGGQLRGNAFYGRHAPAVGAVVIVRPEGATTPLRLSTTGEDGAFGFDQLADGTYRVEVRREGCTPVVKSGVAVKAPFRAVAELVLVRGADAPAASPAPAPGPASDAPAVAIQGTVRMLAGPGVSEARVRLTRIDGAADPRVATTGPDGRFALEALAAGAWRIEILGAGLLPLRTTVDIPTDTSIDAQLAPQPANYQPSPQDLIVPEEAIPPKAS